MSIAAGTHLHSVATPVVVASFGAGGAVFGPLWRVLGNYGWGLKGLSFLVAGLILSAVFSAFLKTPSRHIRTETAQRLQPDKEASRQVVMIWLTFALGSYSGLMVLGLAAKIMDASEIGIVVASAALAGIAICNTGGRLSVAVTAQKLGLRACLWMSFSATIIGLLLLLLGGAAAITISLGLLLIAAGYGIVASTIPVITRAAFGPRDFSRRFAVVFTAWGFAGFSAPWIAGVIFDRMGSFDLAIGAALFIAVCYGIACAALSRMMDSQTS